MKLIVDIDDELVETARFAVRLDMGDDYVKSIANGTPLPKGHGKIVDASEVVKAYAFEKKTNALNGDDDAFIEAINHAPTIIEADKAESEDME